MALWLIGFRSGTPRHSPCRLALRASVAATAYVASAKAKDPLPIRAIVENLSETGSLVRSHERFCEGDRLRLCLRPGTQKRLDVHAEVVYARSQRFQAESQYGLRFVDMSDELAEALGSYVRELMRAQFMRSGKARAV